MHSWNVFRIVLKITYLINHPVHLSSDLPTVIQTQMTKQSIDYSLQRTQSKQSGMDATHLSKLSSDDVLDGCDIPMDTKNADPSSSRFVSNLITDVKSYQTDIISQLCKSVIFDLEDISEYDGSLTLFRPNIYRARGYSSFQSTGNTSKDNVDWNDETLSFNNDKEVGISDDTVKLKWKVLTEIGFNPFSYL